MAKRAPKAEQPYEPVKESLIRSVLNPNSKEAATSQVAPQHDPSPLPPPPRPRAVPSQLPTAVSMPRTVAPKKREKRLLLSVQEEAEIERLVQKIAAELGTTLKLSHVLRASIRLLLNAEDEIVRHARAEPPMNRPPNSQHEAIAVFETQLSNLIQRALRTV